jgi:hypothetical protein
MPMAFAAIRVLAGIASRHLDPALGARVRADQIARLFTQWRRTTASMLVGASILTVVMWGTAPLLFAAWLVAIAANQAWRYRLASATASPCRDRWSACDGAERGHWARPSPERSILAMRTSRLDGLLKLVVPWLLRDTAERRLGGTRISPPPSQSSPIEGEGVSKKSAPRGGAGGQTEFGMTG